MVRTFTLKENILQDGMLKIMLPAGGDLITRVFKSGREHPAECRAVREDIDARLTEALREW